MEFLFVFVVAASVLIGIHLRRQRERRTQNPPRQENSNHITATGPMIYLANNPHNLPDREYRFNYRLKNGGWYAYILRVPQRDPRTGSIPHRLSDSDGPYICWGSTVRTLRDMQNISRAWADNVQEYIATGRSF